MAVSEFHNDDEGYIRWRHEHDWNGFIVAMMPSRDPADAYLHRADCETLEWPLRKGQALTANPKACSTRRSELREYWRHQCSVCDPGP